MPLSPCQQPHSLKCHFFKNSLSAQSLQSRDVGGSEVGRVSEQALDSRKGVPINPTRQDAHRSRASGWVRAGRDGQTVRSPFWAPEPGCLWDVMSGAPSKASCGTRCHLSVSTWGSHGWLPGVCGPRWLPRGQSVSRGVTTFLCSPIPCPAKRASLGILSVGVWAWK